MCYNNSSKALVCCRNSNRCENCIALNEGDHGFNCYKHCNLDKNYYHCFMSNDFCYKIPTIHSIKKTNPPIIISHRNIQRNVEGNWDVEYENRNLDIDNEFE